MSCLCQETPTRPLRQQCHRQFAVRRLTFSSASVLVRSSNQFAIVISYTFLGHKPTNVLSRLKGNERYEASLNRRDGTTLHRTTWRRHTTELSYAYNRAERRWQRGFVSNSSPRSHRTYRTRSFGHTEHSSKKKSIPNYPSKVKPFGVKK